MKTLFVLFFHDFAFAVKSKSIYLVLFIPLFVFTSEYLLDRSKTDNDKFKIATLSSDNYSPSITKALREAETKVEFVAVNNEAEGRTLLKEHAVQGVVVADESGSRLSLIVLRKESPETLAIVQLFSASSWISQVTGLREGGLQTLNLATWMLMLVLLVGFIILPVQVAEEKEKRLILAVLQTPALESQWLLSKIMFGMVLSLAAVGLLLLLSQFVPYYRLGCFVFIALGAYCFSASGVFLGLLCRHQASARTLGFIFYLPLLLPSALGEFSKKLTVVAPFLPSYQFFSPLPGLLFGGSSLTALIFPMAYFFVLGSVLMGLSYLLLQKRWLMNT